MKGKKTTAHITLDIRKLPEGYFLATSTDVQGLIAQGKTFEETVSVAQDLATILLREQTRSRSSIDASALYENHIIYPMAVQL